MKFLQNNYGLAIFLLFLSFSLIFTIKPKKKSVKKTSLSHRDPNHLAVTTLLLELGSKKSVKTLSANLAKKCKNLKIIERTKTSIKRLRSGHLHIRRVLKKKTVPRYIKKALYKKFFLRLFKRLLKCPVVANSKEVWQINNAVKFIKKGKLVPNGEKAIRKLAKVTKSKPKAKVGFFAVLRKYNEFNKKV